MRIFLLASFTFLIAVLVGCDGAQNAGNNANRRPRVLNTPRISSTLPKVVAFGDSLTAGFGLAEKESYPYLLQEKLRADGLEFEVVNAGVSGETTMGGLERIDWVLEQENVRIMILELGANDMLRGVPVDRMRSNLDQMIRRAKSRGVRVLLCGMLAPPTMGAQYQRDFVKAFPELAAEHRVEFLPFLLENVATVKELNQADGIHPNAQGARVMTENVYKALRPMLTAGQ